MDVIIEVIVSLTIAIFCFVVAWLQNRKRGYVFSNRYIFASKEERVERDWTDYYNQSRNVFFLIGILQLILAFYELFDIPYYVLIVFVIIIILYVIISSYKIMKKHGL